MISKTTEYPIEWISVEVDTRCNIRCTMCPIAHDLVENQASQLIQLTSFANLQLDGQTKYPLL